ncbi:hypothetical protein ACH47X_11395 [Promicromonospora kroppenstedtii]|uniref:Uncharacterized protein n=1 Tax=Promicromonospora kroppenstedtii TaxID=440482 RepID=A0ABW7XJ16_9MICO
MRLPRLPARLSDVAARPLPQITVETGPTVPGWVLRLALLALTPALLLLAASRSDLAPALVTTVVVACTALLVLRPTPATAGVTVVLAGVFLWGFGARPDGDFDPAGLAVALLAYAVVRATWWATHLPARGRAEIAALTAGWRRDVVVLAATGLLGALALLASDTALPGAVLLAALAVLGLAFVALATGRDARDDGEH